MYSMRDVSGNQLGELGLLADLEPLIAMMECFNRMKEILLSASHCQLRK